MIANLNTRDAIIWAAGFIDADGHCRVSQGTITIQVNQVEMYPIVMLKVYFGGKVYFMDRTNQRKEGKNWNDMYAWRLAGKSAIALMMSMYGVMSSHKRKAQIRQCLKYWRRRENFIAEARSRICSV